MLTSFELIDNNEVIVQIELHLIEEKQHFILFVFKFQIWFCSATPDIEVSFVPVNMFHVVSYYVVFLR